MEEDTDDLGNELAYAISEWLMDKGICPEASEYVGASAIVGVCTAVAALQIAASGRADSSTAADADAEIRRILERLPPLAAERLERLRAVTRGEGSRH